MAEKICPMMNLATGLDDDIPWIVCNNGMVGYVEGADKYKRPCALWENGDCGRKVARGDRWKEAWERSKKEITRRGKLGVAIEIMDKIESEIQKEGKGGEKNGDSKQLSGS